MPFYRGSIQIAVENGGDAIYVNKYDLMAVVCNEKLDITNIRLVDEKVVIDYISNWSLARGCMKLKVWATKEKRGNLKWRTKHE